MMQNKGAVDKDHIISDMNIILLKWL